jgi:hypothetical protein
MNTVSRVPTFATVLLGILADDSLSASRRNGIASALRSFAKWTGMALNTIPAHPRYLRERMININLVAADISKERMMNVRSLLGAALEHAGVSRIPGRYRVPLAPAWESLIKLLPNPMSRFRLSRFSQFCSGLSIAPAAVDNATFDAFERRLDAADLKDSPRDLARTARQFWNKAVNTIPGWPQRYVMVPDYTNTYAVPWDAFPASLRAEADAWFTRLAGTDPLDELPFRPLRPSSIATRRRQLHEYVSALVRSGHNPDSLRSLADLVQVDRLKDALRFIIARKLAAERPDEADIPAREVKNAVEINALLPSETVRMITIYLDRYHPLLADPALPFLFPGKGGKAKGTDMMRTQIKRVTADDGAIDITPHFARHFAAKHFLTKNPGQYGVVRLVLGHKSVNTTTKYYADTDSTHANQMFVAHVTQMRGPDEGNEVSKPKSKRETGTGIGTTKRQAAAKRRTRKEQ